jgi:hypothetical protein
VTDIWLGFLVGCAQQTQLDHGWRERNRGLGVAYNGELFKEQIFR